jgi:cytochrome c oxidase subunit 2
VASGLLLLLAAPAAWAEVQPETSYHFPRDVSYDGWRIDQLIEVTTIFVLLLFVIMCAWMFYACFFHHKDHPADYDHGTAKHHVMIALSLSALIFLVVDGNLFVTSMLDLDEVFWNFGWAERQENTVRIEVNARQWAWEARYAGNDARFGTEDDVVTLNDVRVPVHAPVVAQLAAVDVIHSMYLPNLRVKIDATPGMINRLWFRARQTGEFDIGCAQHCGTFHYKMKGKLTILTQEQFDTWLRERSAEAQRAYDPDDFGAHWAWPWDRGIPKTG